MDNFNDRACAKQLIYKLYKINTHLLSCQLGLAEELLSSFGLFSLMPTSLYMLIIQYFLYIFLHTLFTIAFTMFIWIMDNSNDRACVKQLIYKLYKINAHLLSCQLRLAEELVSSFGLFSLMSTRVKTIER